MSEHHLRATGYIPVSAHVELSDGGLALIGTPRKLLSGMEITGYECSCGADFDKEKSAIEHHRENNE